MSSETTPAGSTVTGTAIDVPADEPQNGSEPAPKGNREARYRVERNEARDQLSAANARIERMQRAEVQRLASDGLSHPEDLFSLSGNDVADYLTETGDIDAAKVAADVAEILAERPGLRKNAPAFDPSQGRGGKTPPPQREPSWSDLLKS